jgi:hypothetical protein
MERENQYTIIEEATGLLLYCKKDNIVIEGQIAITEMCNLENSDQKPIYWDFENKIFYLE